MDEEWRDVYGWEGLYQVSSLGRVKSLARGTYKDGRILRLINRPPYLVVNFYTKGCPRTQRTVHSLVLEAFVCPRPEGLQCCHNNGQPKDNRVDNLRWDTPSANNRDKVLHNTHQRGERNGNTSLTEAQAREIIQRRKAGESGPKIAKDYGIHKDTVYNIERGVTWAHLS